MELDCTTHDGCTFDSILEDESYPVKIRTPEGMMLLTKHGSMSYSKYAKCVIFPKGKTTWEGFVPPCNFKEGDILITAHGNPFILKEIDNNKICESYCGIRQNGEFVIGSSHWTSNYNLQLATEEEKQKLFQAIKDNGYRWNAETKTLEKEEKKDKFDIATLKPFDKVLVRDNDKQEWIISFFSHCNGLECYKYSCINGCGYAYCIPYEHNEHLLGTTNDYDEYYKTWKDETDE